jgi:hypothetical protein
LNHTPGLINSTVRAWVKYWQGLGDKPPHDTYWVVDEKTRDGPMWSREMARGRAPYEFIAELLQLYDANQILIGHTPTATSRITKRYGGFIVMIDTGISRAYGGELSAYEYDNEKVTIYNLITRLGKPSPLKEKIKQLIAGQ